MLESDKANRKVKQETHTVTAKQGTDQKKCQ